MDSPGEILRLCRLCLVKDQVNIPIFDEQGDTRQIFLKISSCLPVKVSREDRLPKKICDGCSEKLNSFYEFWSSSANAEKTLLSWVGQEEEEEKKEPTIPKPIAALVKEESEVGEETPVESIEESTKDEAEAPPAKRARRSAAVKAQINITPESEDDDLDNAEPMTKLEDESAESDSEDKDPSYTDIPGTSADDEQAGPSGVGKDGVEAPKKKVEYKFMVKTDIEFEHCVEGTFRFRDHQNRTVYVPKINSGYGCPYCAKQFQRQGNLKHHIIQHLLEKRRYRHEWRCSLCNKSFRNKLNLMFHQKTAHTSSSSFLCQVCGQIFHDEQQCQLHCTTHQYNAPQVGYEDIVMPVITSFGTVVDDAECKKRSGPAPGYESEYAKFLEVSSKELSENDKDKKKRHPVKKEFKKTKHSKVFVIESVKPDSSTLLVDVDSEIATEQDPLSAITARDIKPKIFVKEFAHFDE